MSVVAVEQRLDKTARTFDSVVQQHKNRIFTYVCRLTDDSPDAEDITQEVFIRAYQSLAAFRDEAAVDTWLYRIATNLVIDRFRRQKRAPQLVSTAPDEDDPLLDVPAHARAADPHANVQLGELQREVQRAIQALPPKLRTAVVLHDLEGLPYEDVSTVMSIPIGTVKSRLFKARSLLRMKLQRYVEGDR